MSDIPRKLLEKLELRQQAGLLRKLHPAGDGVDFCSNDYLGFARCSQLSQDKNTYMGRELGGGSSRLISGNHQLYDELEKKLAQFHRAGAALVFNSGYDANLGIFSSLPQRSDIVLYDQSVHASIRDGLRLGNVRSYSFDHNSLESLDRRARTVLKSGIPNDAEVYVVTEAIFSMEGDGPELREWADYCGERQFRLILDEAHAVGILGPGGMGASVAAGVEDRVFARVITFGKALGRHGAAVLCSQQTREYLINFSRSLIYTTALPPHTLATILDAYELLEGTAGLEARALLRSNREYFRETAATLGLGDHFSNGAGAIFNFRVDGNRAANELAASLQGSGFQVRPILSPTVPEGRECLRFCLHSFNTPEEISGVLSILAAKTQAMPHG